MKGRIEVFLSAFAVWCLLIWPYCQATRTWDIQGISGGLFAALAVSFIFGGGFVGPPGHVLDPRRWMYAFIFIFVFLYYCIKANLQVAYMVLHPALPIRPGIVKMRTTLRSKPAIAVLSICITLTPGTLTVEATEGGVLFVHWLNVSTTDEHEAGRLIAGKFEYFLKKIFEDRK